MLHKTGDANRSFDQFSKEFNMNQACYGIYDSETKKKLILIHWNPNDAPVKSRMLTSTTLKAVQDSLVGLGAAQQVTDHAELKTACL